MVVGGLKIVGFQDGVSKKKEAGESSSRGNEVHAEGKERMADR